MLVLPEPSTLLHHDDAPGHVARVLTSTLLGLGGVRVRVEADVAPGLPGFSLVGLPSVGLRESRERIGAALRNAGFHWPEGRVTVSLAPADLRKDGAAMDLAIALAMLLASSQVPRPSARWLRRTLFVGELALDGALRPARGTVAMAMDAAALGVDRVVVPEAQRAELEDLGAVEVLTLAHLSELRSILGRRGVTVGPAPDLDFDEDLGGVVRRLGEVRGQARALRALLIAAAGGHHLVLQGPPGCGKTLLARRLVDLLPPLDGETARQRRRIHSSLGRRLDARAARRPPFRAPHHTASAVSLVGGGRPIRPGEITLAHAGVLLLDELPEFGAALLDRLREPLVEGEVLLSRAGESVVFPCRFQLVATANPCPCGWFGSAVDRCRCTHPVVERYRRRLSGPLRDRIPLWVEMDREAAGHLLDRPDPARDAPDLATIERVRRVRHLRTTGARSGLADVSADLNADARSFLEVVADRGGLSARAVAALLDVSRTIALLDDREEVRRDDVAEAITYRASQDP